MNTVSVDQLHELIAPSLRHCGVELFDLVWSGGGMLRILIDKPGGVTLDDCERVSMAIGAVLDAYDPIASRYQLEVSSPGAERPLRNQREWRDALGHKVRVEYLEGESQIIIEGQLLGVSEATVEIEIREARRTSVRSLPLGRVVAARIVVDI